MSALRKITVTVPARDLQFAQELTGKGITETVRIALRQLADDYAQRARTLRSTKSVNLDIRGEH
jgi:Arc/MetJ-type ribon-helix-helix transcriptional regulator